MGVVTRSGAQLLLDGAPFRYVGVNCYQLAKNGNTPQTQLQWLTELQALDVRAVRIWAFGESTAASNPDINTLQYGATGGQWNEPAFVVLDNAIAAAGALGIKLILCCANQWSAYGGKAVYAQWYNAANATSLVADNFHDTAGVISLYKAFLSKLITRQNTVTGIRYNADPAILAWEMINEGRYTTITDTNANTLTSTRLQNMTAWYSQIAAYIKSLDSLHLVGSGGIFQAYDYIAGDPVHNGTYYGLDFNTQHQDANIDYCDFHLYPANNYSSAGSDCTLIWPNASSYHAQLAQFASWAQGMNKPLVVHEVGIDKRNTVTSPLSFYPRAPYLRAFHSEMLANNVTGWLLWNYRADGNYGILSGAPDSGASTVAPLNTDESAIFNILSEQSLGFSYPANPSQYRLLPVGPGSPYTSDGFTHLAWVKV